MEGKKKTGVRVPRRKHKPVKTEQNARSVLLTYFEGDINSVVDEHFSRALSKFKRPQRWTSSSHGENVVLKNENTMPPNQWCLTSSWTKPQPEASTANGASSSSLNEYGLKAIDQYPLSMVKTPCVYPQAMWHFPALARPTFQEPAYFHGFSERPLAPEIYPGSRLYLLHQDRYLNRPLEPATSEQYNFTSMAGGAGLFMNLPPTLDHYKKIYGHGCGSPFCNFERIQYPERKRYLYFY